MEPTEGDSGIEAPLHRASPMAPGGRQYLRLSVALQERRVTPKDSSIAAAIAGSATPAFSRSTKSASVLSGVKSGLIRSPSRRWSRR